METRLEKHDPDKNLARYYRMSVLPNLFGEWTLQREWGRIGQGGRVRLDLFRSALEAKSALELLESAKQRREYEKVNQTGFTGEHKAWKVSHDKKKFRKPFFDRSASARSAFGA